MHAVRTYGRTGVRKDKLKAICPFNIYPVSIRFRATSPPAKRHSDADWVSKLGGITSHDVNERDRSLNTWLRHSAPMSSLTHVSPKYVG